jgi:hypothetical protein
MLSVPDCKYLIYPDTDSRVYRISTRGEPAIATSWIQCFTSHCESQYEYLLYLYGYRVSPRAVTRPPD